MVNYNIVERPYPEALLDLQQKVNGYRRSWEQVYIGITANPEERWNRHAQGHWEKLVVIYEAYSPDIARDAEQQLIASARNANFLADITNIRSGGEGLNAQSGRCFVYVLVADRRSQRN